ncbi:MAG: hypothetical protein MPN21_20470 [Thermoanaerobaculia bacterium]|nr:hypothetical protein [Thermoanaerobaculia bacterium]
MIDPLSSARWLIEVDAPHRTLETEIELQLERNLLRIADEKQVVREPLGIERTSRPNGSVVAQEASNTFAGVLKLLVEPASLLPAHSNQRF